MAGWDIVITITKTTKTKTKTKHEKAKQGEKVKLQHKTRMSQEKIYQDNIKWFNKANSKRHWNEELKKWKKILTKTLKGCNIFLESKVQTTDVIWLLVGFKKR